MSYIADRGEESIHKSMLSFFELLWLLQFLQELFLFESSKNLYCSYCSMKNLQTFIIDCRYVVTNSSRVVEQIARSLENCSSYSELLE